MAFRAKGFSLIELVVVVAIMAVLFALGLPALSAYSLNLKVRSAAESFLAGVQQARGEAIRLNTAVELILTNAAPVPDDGADSDFPVLAEEAADNLGVVVQSGKLAANFAAAHASSTWDDRSYNWLVRTLPTEGGACAANSASTQAKACWFISGKKGAEGSGGAAVDSASKILIEGPAAVSFSPLGGASAASEFNFSSPSGGDCVLVGGPVRCLRVKVELGGRAKLCDPAATAVGDTRGCS